MPFLLHAIAAEIPNIGISIQDYLGAFVGFFGLLLVACMGASIAFHVVKMGYRWIRGVGDVKDSDFRMRGSKNFYRQLRKDGWTIQEIQDGQKSR